MVEDPELDRPVPASPSTPPAGAEAESGLAQRARELHVLQSLGRLAAEAQTPEALFRGVISALQRNEPLDAAAVAIRRAGAFQVEMHLSRPFSAACLDLLADRTLAVLGPPDPAVPPRLVQYEADDYDARRGERRELASADLLTLPVLRRGRVEACLALLPVAAAGEAQLRVLYSATNHLGLHLDRLLTAREDEAQRFRAILDTMPQPVILTDGRLEPVHVNRSATRLLGRLASGSLAAFVDQLGVGSLVARVVRDGAAVAGVEATARDGTIFSVSLSPHGGEDPDRTGLVIVLTDVTDSRRMQQRLAQAEKMSSLGQMISGTAHELNNPLSSVLGYVQLLRASAGGDDTMTRRLQAIETEAERCHRIVDNLLAFARHRPPERRPVSINETVQSVLSLMGYQLRTGGILVSSSLAPDLPAVEADAHQLQQVLVNLLTNAMHAIRDRRDTGEVRVVTRVDPDGVGIEVHDDGPGVPAEVRSRIFDPFFTTKDETRGTGLGLSIVYGIVAAHGGTIEQGTSELGGACFRLTLPLRPSAAAVPDDGAQAAPIPSPGPRRILVVDDEPPLRGMLCEALALDGHSAVSAADGNEALQRLAEERFDLIVCDVRMPGMDADRLLSELDARHPGLKGRVLLTTGDTVGNEPDELARREGLDLLHKPFGLDDLRDRVRRLLARIEPA